MKLCDDVPPEQILAKFVGILVRCKFCTPCAADQTHNSQLEKKHETWNMKLEQRKHKQTNKQIQLFCHSNWRKLSVHSDKRLFEIYQLLPNP